MKELFKIFSVALCLLLSMQGKSQDTLFLSLERAIDQAFENSSLSKRINHNYNSSYWQYKIYRATTLPVVTLNGTLPDFNRSITPQLLPDGTQNFISYNNFNSDLSLRVAQPITLTGGQIFVNSNLQQIVNVELDDGTSYFTNPISIGFNQEIMGFNRYRWLKETEPMKYEEAKREILEKKEDLSLSVVQSFFSYLIALERFEIAKKNYKNNKELMNISTGRYNLGLIAENDLLQMELSVLQSSLDVENSRIDVRRSRSELYSLLNLSNSEKIKPILPSEIDTFLVDPDHAVQQALSNRKDVIAFERQLLEAEMNVAEAKANKRIQVNLFGSFGLNQSATTLQGAYQNPLDQERFNLGVQIPIYDAGAARSKYKIAESESNVVYYDVQELKQRFERDVRLKANDINLLNLKLKIAAKSDTIAQKRYIISNYRYKQGKISITDYNIAQLAKDESRISYLNTLKDYWSSYYQIRKLTLYDYRLMNPIKD